MSCWCGNKATGKGRDKVGARQCRRASVQEGGRARGRSSSRKAGDLCQCLTISHAPPAGFLDNSSRKRPSPMQPWLPHPSSSSAAFVGDGLL
jgi:hypothetical protein